MINYFKKIYTIIFFVSAFYGYIKPAVDYSPILCSWEKDDFSVNNVIIDEELLGDWFEDSHIISPEPNNNTSKRDNHCFNLKYIVSLIKKSAFDNKKDFLSQDLKLLSRITELEELEPLLLHQVLQNNAYNTFQVLLENGFNPNFKDSCGFTPLYLAIKRKKIDAIDLLLKHNADANFIYNGIPIIHELIFMYSDVTERQKNELFRLIEFFLYKIDFNAVDKYGHNALFWSANKQCIDLAILFFKNNPAMLSAVLQSVQTTNILDYEQKSSVINFLYRPGI